MNTRMHTQGEEKNPHWVKIMILNSVIVVAICCCLFFLFFWLFMYRRMHTDQCLSNISPPQGIQHAWLV